jgi:hypothetical protein
VACALQGLIGVNMKTTVNVYDFRDAFKRMGRDSQFSYEALGILFQYLEDYEEITGEEMELDVVAICCEYSESTWQEIESSYVIDMEDIEDDAEDLKKQRVIDYLTDEGEFVGEADNKIIYRQH